MLLRLDGVRLAFGAAPVLQDVELTIGDREARIGLIGRNGEGKSTLLKVISGLLPVDGGEINRRQGLVCTYLDQGVPEVLSGSIYDVVAEGLPEVGAVLRDYHALLQDADPDLTHLDRLQSRIDALDGWQADQRIHQTLSKMGLDADTVAQPLSGGMKRRVLLARCLVQSPDILVLDEPTNHLDIHVVAWLADLLAGINCAVVLVTHDRNFLEQVANRIIELDRGQLHSFPGTYQQYLVARQNQLEAEAAERARFEKRLGQEEVWIRQGIKARRTRNEGRVRALEAMRREHQAQRKQQGQVSLTVNAGQRSGKRVIEASAAGFTVGEHRIVDAIDLLVARQDRIGIIGPNGCGKTTLIKLLLGEIEPTSGTVRHGTHLQVAYYNQLRQGMDKGATIVEAVSGGQEMLQINGQQKHVMSYLQDFLFSPARARTPIDALSGGEFSRVLLAKLFLQPSNLLVLDEPSNDLDIETLELLEDLIANYHGTVILVSHDRRLLDNCVTYSLVYQGNGRFAQVVGGYSDYLIEMQRGGRLKSLESLAGSTGRPGSTAAAGSSGATGGVDEGASAGNGVGDSSVTGTSTRRGTGLAPGTSASSTHGQSVAQTATQTPTAKAASKPVKKKLAYREQKELDALPERIASLEKQLKTLHAEFSNPDSWANPDTATRLASDEKALNEEIQHAYARWEALEEMTG